MEEEYEEIFQRVQSAVVSIYQQELVQDPFSHRYQNLQMLKSVK